MKTFLCYGTEGVANYLFTLVKHVVDVINLRMNFISSFRAQETWYSSPWFLKTDLLVQGHDTIQSSLKHILSINHPYDSMQNVLAFLGLHERLGIIVLFRERTRLLIKFIKWRKQLLFIINGNINKAPLHWVCRTRHFSL